MDTDFEHNLRHKDSMYKYVKVKTVDSSEHEGWLKCIDPMSGNLILISFNETLTKPGDAVLIMGDGYTSLEVIKEADEKMKKLIAQLYQPDEILETVHERKRRLLAWIKKNRIPVIENDDETLFVIESVTIAPPYEVDNCSGAEKLVLESIRELVGKLPNDSCDS